MPFTIPNDLVGTTSTYQSLIYATDVDVLQAGIQGVDCVLSGLAVTASGTTTVSVAKGSVLSNGIMYAIAADTTFGDGTTLNTTETFGTLTSAQHRFDLIVVNSAGALKIRAGTAVATNVIPIMPSRTANDVVIACVYQTGTDPDTPNVNIVTADLVDKRVFRNDAVIWRTTTSQTQTMNTSPETVHLLNRTGEGTGGITIPNGLLTAGKILKCRVHGHLVSNAATTGTFSIILGATTLWSAATAATAIVTDADEYGFDLDFVIAAVSTTSQRLHGRISTDVPGARTAPAGGLYGDIQAGSKMTTPIGGTGAENTDGGNLTLSVTFASSVGNASTIATVSFSLVEIV